MFEKVSFKQVNTLYSTSNISRYDTLITKFQQIYNSKPEFISRAPGRVNIIGQHIDYEGYGVLPAAIEKDFLIAVRTNDSKIVQINHTHDKIYQAGTFNLDPQHNKQIQHKYLTYIHAGYEAGVFGIPVQQLKGLDILISGNVPIAAGLSSSSALCVSIALAALHANNGEGLLQGKISNLIERVIKFERLLGTACGGMDQTISVMGKKNSCLHINFNPISGVPVVIPEGCKFIIMDSLVQSAKFNTAVFRYNKRVCECRIAVSLLSIKLGTAHNYLILKEIQHAAEMNLELMSQLVDQFIHHHDYTQEQIQGLIGRPLEAQLHDIPLFDGVIKANKTYKIYQAAKHVFEEAHRVEQFIQVCRSQLAPRVKCQLLGRLMNQSQFSCKNLYDCSCPQLDDLTDQARKAGALGSRLTGAGWGGCTVSLVPNEKVQSFKEEMLKTFYSVESRKEKIQRVGIQNIMFESQPCPGACIISLE